MGLTNGVTRGIRAAIIASMLALTALPLSAQQKKGNAPPQKKMKAPLDSEKIAPHKAEAQARALFQSQDPITFRIVADYKTVLKDRDTLTTKEYPATLILKDGDVEKKFPITLHTRGHFRLQSRNCQFVPLRVTFDKKEVKGTVFDGQSKLKLGTHCQSSPEYEQYVLREYTAYKVQNLLTDRSYRVRLARVTYDDSVTGKSFGEHNGILYEDQDDVARRLEGEVVNLPHALFTDVDASQINQVSVFEYFIGNTDWSLYALHNVQLIRKLDGTLLPIARDLDFSGLVDTRYATPDYRLPIKSVKERLYRGPCRSVEEIDKELSVYRDKQQAIMAVYDSMPGLDKGYVKSAKGYINDFYKSIGKPRDVKSTFVDTCDGKPSV